MTTFSKFEDIDAWQKARVLTNQIYDITESGRFSKDFALCNQIRRSAISIMSNIAEGFERGGSKEFLQFLSIAKGSAGEIRSQLYIAVDREYIEQSTFDELYQKVIEISRMLNGLIKYLKSSKLKGHKYK